MPKVSMAEVVSWMLKWNTPVSRKYQIDRSSSPSPTTVKPMTEPAEKATRSPWFKLSEAACAVRQLAAVAIFMPIKPDSAEKKPPVTNANGT